MTIGARLREQRNQLGMSQTDFGALVKAVRHTVHAWENDTTMPNAADLLSLADAGVDVMYVLTGQRSGALNSEEAALLDNYRHSSPDSQRILRETSATFAKPVTSHRRRA